MNISDLYLKYFRNNVTTDSRNVKQGDIFVALRGENFDGNKFAAKAINDGASIAVIDNDKYLSSEGNFYLVNNSLKFLQQLAIYHRSQIGINIIGITGTNGKTTTKELIHSVLSQQFSCSATKGNLNNHIGVPLTLLSFDNSIEWGIVEMGANHVGEIAELCEIAQPDTGLITNIGKAHLEGFGSYEGVIKAKSELYDYLKSKNGKIFVNGRDDLLISILSDYPHKTIYNSSTGNCSYLLREGTPGLKMELESYNSFVEVSSSLHGEYNIPNIMAAASIGIYLNIPLEKIARAIESYKPDNNRSESVSFGSNNVIFDCYNANPTSMQVAIESFGKLPSEKKVVIIGEMKELGKYEKEEHQKVAELIGRHAFDEVFLVGDAFGNIQLAGAIHLKEASELENYFNPGSRENTSFLVKGSRANKLEVLKDFLPNQGLI